MPLTVPPHAPSRTFLGFPYCPDPERLEADFAILGIPYGDPYSMDEVTNDQTRAPAAVRRESERLSTGLDHWDFDLGGTLLDGRDVRVVDCGDVPGDPADLPGNRARAEAAARAIVGRGAVPVVIGGDHGVPIPVFRALDAHAPVALVHVDAHIDWRDEVNGAREGYSSPIRRASEMAHFGPIVQVGMRAQGSARTGEVEAARAHGAALFTAYDVHARGMGPVLERVPRGARCHLSIDADGLDPSVMPAVAAPAPGGLLFHQVRELIHGLAARARLVGMDIVEITPGRDLNGISSITAGQLILNFIGAAVRAAAVREDGGRGERTDD